MRAHKTLIAMLLAAALLPTLACKKDKKAEKGAVKAGAKGEGKGRAAEAAGAIPAPKELVLYIGLRNPQETIDDGLALVNQFVPLPLNRDGLLDLLSSKAKLPRDLISSINIEKTFWLLGFDEKQVDEKDPAVMVFPLKSKKAFEAALAKRMDRGKAAGDLVTYKPKAGQVGLEPVKMWITDTHAIVATSENVLKITSAFITRTLLGKKPDHDMVMHVMVKPLIKEHREAFDSRVGKMMDKMKDNVKDKGSSAVDPKQVASATEATLRRWIDAIKSTGEVQILADVDKEHLTLSLVGTAAGGRMAQLVKRQRTGAPVGIKVLPRSSWLVFSDNGNPEASREGMKTWEPVFKEIIKDLPAAQQEKLSKSLGDLAEVFTGDFTAALHKGPAGKGLAMSVVTKVADAGKSQQAYKELAGVLEELITAAMKKESKEAARGIKLDRVALDHEGARGEVFRLHLPLPPEKKAQADRAVGLPLTLGIAFSGEYALLTAGKGADVQLKRLAAGLKAGKVDDSLTDNPAYKRAQTSAPSRVGLLYVSVVDFFRWFEGTGVKEAEDVAKALKGKDIKTSPSLDWGVDDKRDRMDITLRIPAEHFKAFKPIIEELKKKGMPRGLMGP